MTAHLAVPVVPSWIAFLICLAVFSLFVAVACWIDGNKGRRVYNDLLEADQRATRKRDRCRTCEEMGITAGPEAHPAGQTRAEDDVDVGRERWSA